MARKIGNFLRKEKALLVLLGGVIFLSVYNQYFLTLNNIRNVLTQCSITGVIAIGMTFAIIGGEFDLSVGATMSLSGMLCVLLQPYMPLPVVLVLAVLSGAAIGFVNGFFIAHQGANAFIITLASGIAFKGIALTISDGQPVMGRNLAFMEIANGEIRGIPYPVLIFAVLAVAAHLVLTRTPFGRNIFAIGGNRSVAGYAGISVRFYKWMLFVITGAMAAAGGILYSSRLNAGSAIYGDNIPLQVISAVVVGGTALSGGVGSMGNTLVGLLLFGVLDNALSLMNVNGYYQTGIKGLLVALIVGMGCYAATHEKMRKLAADK